LSAGAADVEHKSSESEQIDIRTPGKIDKLLIVRLSAMGDVIHTLPAVHALRAALPKAHIGWLIEERWVELLCAAGAARRGPRSAMRPLVDEVHTVRLKDWGKSLFSVATLQGAATVLSDVRSGRYDVAVDLQGAIRSAVLARWSGAQVIYGAAQPREAPASLWYTRKVVAQGTHVIEQYFSLIRTVIESLTNGGRPENFSSGDLGVNLPCDPQTELRTERRLAELKLGEFAVLNPGAGWGAKRWPAERYGEVARGLAKCGLRSIINYGPGEESLAREVEAASGGSAAMMSCSITELIALTRRAKLFVGGDTGPLHLAAALRIPAVGIYGPTDPARNGPFAVHSVVLRSAESVTSHARRAEADEGMLEIESGAVVTAAEKLLSGISQ
jgi:heptosyltransferase I